MDSKRIALNRMYEYRRTLPHYQKAGRGLFVTFCKNNREPFSDEARNSVLQCCLRGHGTRFQLHAAVIMPDHVPSADSTAGRNRLAARPARNSQVD